MRTRLFKLNGIIYAPESTGTVTINGIQVFQGIFNGNVVDPDVEETQDDIAIGSYTLDDATDVSVPVTVTLTSGQMDLGMFEWNYAKIPVPGSDPVIYVADPDTFAFGTTSEMCLCNRTNELINGQPVPEPGTNIPIMMHGGDVVTFNTVIFAGPPAA